MNPRFTLVCSFKRPPADFDYVRKNIHKVISDTRHAIVTGFLAFQISYIVGHGPLIRMDQFIHNSKKLAAMLPIVMLTLLIALSIPVNATPACTPTACNFKGSLNFGPIGNNPCTGVLSNDNLVVTGNFALHASADGNHFTMTATGTTTFTQVDSVVFTGHVTAWDGGNLNPATGQMELTGTFHIHVTGSDGSSVSFLALNHITINPDGTITSNINTGHTVCS